MSKPTITAMPTRINKHFSGQHFLRWQVKNAAGKVVGRVSLSILVGHAGGFSVCLPGQGDKVVTKDLGILKFDTLEAAVAYLLTL